MRLPPRIHLYSVVTASAPRSRERQRVDSAATEGFRIHTNPHEWGQSWPGHKVRPYGFHRRRVAAVSTGSRPGACRNGGWVRNSCLFVYIRGHQFLQRRTRTRQGRRVSKKDRNLTSVWGAHPSRVPASASRRRLKSSRRDAGSSLRDTGAPPKTFLPGNPRSPSFSPVRMSVSASCETHRRE